MVEIKDLTHTASSPRELLQTALIQRHNDLIEAIESFEKLNINSDPDTSVIRARTISLFLFNHAFLKTNLEGEDFEKIKDNSFSKKYDDLIEAYIMINETLYEKNLTRLDFMRKRKKTHRSEENDKNA